MTAVEVPVLMWIRIVVLTIAVSGTGYPAIRALPTLPTEIRSARTLIGVLVTGPPELSSLCRLPVAAADEPRQIEVRRAVGELERVRVQNPTSALSLLLLGKAYCLEGRAADAIAAYRDYATLRPTNLQLWLDVGQLAEKSGAWDEAVYHYQRAVVTFPAEPLLHARLGNSLHRNGRGYVAALYEIRRAIALSPEGQFYASGGQILANERRFAEADEWFAKAIEAEPETPWWYALRADSTLAAGNVTGAGEAYTSLMQRFPAFPQAYFQSAWVHRLNNRPDLAIRMIERALVLSHHAEPWYWVRAGAIYEWAGMPAQALRAYRAALSIEPTIDAAAQGVNRLTEQK